MNIRHLFGAVALSALLITAGCGKKDEAPALTASQQAVVEHAPPEGKAMSPGAVNRVLADRGFTPSSVKRRGSTYVVDARGRSGNQVRLVIDGKAGQITGLDVTRWAPGVKRITQGSRGVAFVNDTYEFGHTLPDAALADWVDYQPAQWTTYTPWIDYGEDYVVDHWGNVYYESDVEEMSYDDWVAAFGPIQEWSDESFYDDSDWDDAVEVYYADNTDAFADDYGYAYDDQVFEEDYYAMVEEEQILEEQAARDEVDYQQQAEAERDVADQEAYDEAAYQEQAEAERDVADQEAQDEYENQQQAEAERDSGYDESVDNEGDY